MNNKIRFICRAAAIAALYCVLTLLSASVGLSSGPIQVRISEALCVLPFFTTAAIPGLAIGCLVANLLTGALILDVIFGTLATVIGAVLTYLLRRYKWLAPVPPILSNTIIIPFVLHYSGMADDGIPYMMATIFAGEFISCGLLGMTLLMLIEKRKLL